MAPQHPAIALQRAAGNTAVREALAGDGGEPVGVDTADDELDESDVVRDAKGDAYYLDPDRGWLKWQGTNWITWPDWDIVMSEHWVPPEDRKPWYEQYAEGVYETGVGTLEYAKDTGAKVVDLTTQGTSALGKATGLYDVGYTKWSSVSKQYEAGVSRGDLFKQSLNQAVPIVTLAKTADAAIHGDWKAIGNIGGAVFLAPPGDELALAGRAGELDAAAGLAGSLERGTEATAALERGAGDAPRLPEPAAVEPPPAAPPEPAAPVEADEPPPEPAAAAPARRSPGWIGRQAQKTAFWLKTAMTGVGESGVAQAIAAGGEEAPIALRGEGVRDVAPTPSGAPVQPTTAPVAEPAAAPVAEPPPPPAAVDPAPATAPAAPARSARTAASEESFGSADFDAAVREVRNSPLGHHLEAAKREAPAALAEDTRRTRAQVDEAAHGAARRNAPAGRVPGAQIQHQTKTLDVTRNLPPGMNPLDVSVINENLLWLQSRRNLPSTLLHIDPEGGGTRFHADDIPRGRVGDVGMPGEQLNLFEPSPGPAAPDYNTEHKFMDNYLIPEQSRAIAAARERAGLPPLDPRQLAITAGEQALWMMRGDPGTTRSGEVVDVAGNASRRPGGGSPEPTGAPQPSPQLELPFGAPHPPTSTPPTSTPPVAPPPPTTHAPPSPTPPAPLEPRPPETPPVEKAPAKPPPEGPGAEHPPTGAKALGAATHAANEGAALLRGYDAYQDARDKGSGAFGAAAQAGQTYLDNTNPVMAMVASARAKQADGQDPVEAWLATAGETIGGYLAPGKGADQAINAGANLTDAIDDHLNRGDPNAAARQQKSNLRTGADLAADLTPSRMASETLGAGARAWWDIGKAAVTGNTHGVDKFGDDATKGKLGAIIQPWAMAADFAGNLGSGEGASKALDKTMAKTKGSTLEKVGSASGDAFYDLGRSDAAKSGNYGTVAQGWSMLSSVGSDRIAGKSWDQALEHAAEPGKDTLIAKAGGALGDAAWAAHEKATEVIDQDLPKLKQAVTDEKNKLQSEAADTYARAKARLAGAFSW